MTPNEYQKLAMRTCNFDYNSPNLMVAYTESVNMKRHAVFGLCSEAGEVASIFQKEYQGHRVDSEHLKKEIGDCLWMIAELCSVHGFELEDVMELNIQKLKERYPEGFDPERSLHRAEGDI